MLYALLVSVGCTSPAPPAPDGLTEISGSAGGAAEVEAAPGAVAPSPQPGELALRLDGTEKWALDDTTRAVMAETHATLDGVIPRSVEEANALGDALQDQLDRLIQGCTMEGAAHDELHVFLTAWMPEVKALQSTTHELGARARVLRLQEMLHTFDQFFA
ncbi:MAG: hypothetical protein R3F61_02355 [Myxococcota bacterium]